MTKPVRTFTVKVPTKGYLRKFLCKLYGPQIPLNYWNPLGTFVLALLERQSFDVNLNDSKTRDRLALNTALVEFYAPMKTIGYKGYSLNKDKEIAINRFLEDMFSRHLYQYCLHRKSDKKWRPGYDNAIIEFAMHCGIDIDTDISMDALKKTEYRYRKRQEEILQTFVLHDKIPMKNFKSNRYISY